MNQALRCIVLYIPALLVLILVLPLRAATAQETGLPVKLVGHGGPIKAISISDDGKYALTASFDYSIIHWELSGKNGKILHRLIGHDSAVNDVAFVPGSRLCRFQPVTMDHWVFGIWAVGN